MIIKGRCKRVRSSPYGEIYRIDTLSSLSHARIRPWPSDLGSTRQSLTGPWPEADPGQPEQPSLTVPASVSARNPKALSWGVALIGGILAPGPGLEPNW